MRYIPLEVENREEVVSGDGSVFRIDEKVTVVAENNLNDKIVTGVLTDIAGSYVSIKASGYTLVVRSSAIIGKQAMDLADKLDRLIYTVDEALAVLDELTMQERLKLPHSEGFGLLRGAFDHLERVLDDLCEAQTAYEKDKK